MDGDAKMVILAIPVLIIAALFFILAYRKRRKMEAAYEAPAMKSLADQVDNEIAEYLKQKPKP